MNFRKSRVRSRRNSTNFMVDAERWRPYGKRLSHRDTNQEAEDSDDDETHHNEVKDWAEEFFGRRSVCGDMNEQDDEVRLTRKQTIVLSTLLPDEILLLDKYEEIASRVPHLSSSGCHDPSASKCMWVNECLDPDNVCLIFDSAEPKRFVGVLLMADVSGYTALSERYNNIGKSGTYRLTVTLNTYLGALIEIIYSHGGDIIKFAGDAFLALWKTDKRSYLYHTVHTVIACALLIQHCYANYETDVKVNLKVKLAISAGNLMFSPIGVGFDMNFVVFGLPVIEAKLAESLCSSGEVNLAPTAWAHCFSRNYDHFIHDDGHVTIKSILYDPQASDITKPFIGFRSMVRQIKTAYSTIETLPDYLWESMDKITTADMSKINEVLNFRKTILVAEKRNIGSEIRKFMIRSVLTQVDAHQPLEYLTEMRQVSVLFLTLKPRECPPAQLITIVNNSYQITCEIVYKSMGCVNKIILFDKDVMTLVLFGLRGYKHESEAQAALKCAYSIKKSVSALNGVLEVSVGVTTGQVYCGVIGHPLRREFTVIGAVVNKAARLMCSFRNKITCDESTFIKSKISQNSFVLQPKTELRGIGHPGKIYEYTEEIRVTKLYDIPIIPPLLNRTEEMECLRNWLNDPPSSSREFDALLLIGESRIGKSRLLEWMAREARNQLVQVCYINLTSIHSANPYLALSQIVNKILGLEEPVSGFSKEEKIVNLLKVYDEDLCYLNNFIKVRFAYKEGIYAQDESLRKEKAKCIFNQIIRSISGTYIICFDDLQNLDAGSWEFISLMFDAMNIFTILTITRGKFSTVHKWLYNVFIANRMKKVILGPLTSHWIAPLACQILDVDAVPNDLCNALRTKCKGMPGLVEGFIVQLFSTGALEVKRINDDELEEFKDEDLQFPDSIQLRAQALNVRDQTTLDNLLEETTVQETKICLVIQKAELNANINLENLDALIMIQIDALTPYQQLLLKIASVIGNVLSRDLLENIMYENNSLVTAKAIKRLFAMRILSCANISRRYSETTTAAMIGPPLNDFNTRLANLECECCFEYDSENSENLPKYAYCKVMKFRNKNSRKTCYALLPINQKKEFHSRVVNYLENNKQKCTDCGGTIMVVQSMMSLQCPEDYYRSSTIKKSTIKDDSVSSDTDEEQKDEYIITKLPSQKENEISDDIQRARSECVSEKINDTDELDQMRDNLPKSAPILKKSIDEDHEKRRRSTKRVTMTSLLFKDVCDEDFNNCKLFDKLRPVTEADDINDWHDLGVIDSNDFVNQKELNNKSLYVKIEKGVSKTNFMKCTCGELNIIIHEQLIHHAKKADMIKKAIGFIIQFSYLNILADNIDIALDKLDDAEEECLNKEIIENSLTEFDKRRYLGKIHSLRAAAYLMSGKLLAAKMELDCALRIYKLNLHNAPQFFITKMLNSLKIKFMDQLTRENILKADSLFCINIATSLYWSLGDEKVARICARRALEIVPLLDCCVIDICEALTNAIQIELDRGFPEGVAVIERRVKNVLKDLPYPIKAEELYAVGKLFMATFRARLAHADLPGAIQSGFRAIAVSHFLYAINISLSIIPDLFYILLSRRRIEEAVDVLKLTQILGYNQESYTSETWYYALCMDLILDAGFQVEPPYEINRFADYVLHISGLEGPGRRRLVINLWTYWLRVNSERKAKRFESEALRWANREDDDGTLTNLLSALRLADGMLESLAGKVDDLRKVVDMVELRSIADRELGRLEKDCRLMRSIYPRWHLIKGNSLSLSGRTNAAMSSFNQAMEEARKIQNKLEEEIARAALSNSKIWIQNGRVSRFVDWRTGAEQAQGSWHQLLYRLSTARH